MAATAKPKKYLIKALKILGWVLLSLVLLLVAISLLIQVPSIQNRIVQEAVGFLKGKINTEVRLRHVSLSFPKRIVLEGLYVEDQSKDTLLYVGELGIDTDLWALTQKQIELNDVQFDTLVANINRQIDNRAFNFDYIVTAFAGDTTSTTPADTTAAPWTFSLEGVGIKNAHAVFDDRFGGMDVRAIIGELNISVDEFDLNKIAIGIDDVSLRNAFVSYTSMATERTSATPKKNTVNSSPSTPFQLGVNQIDLDQIRFTYNDYSSRQLLNINLAKAEIDVDEFDLEKQIVRISDLSLENTFASYHQMVIDSSRINNSPTSDTTSTITPEWLVTVEEIDLTNDAFQYYNFNQPAHSDGYRDQSIDFNRLWISSLNLSGEDLRYHGVGDLAGKIESLSFREKSGFAIQSFESELVLSNTSLGVHNLAVNSGNSSIRANADASFKSFERISTDYPDASVNLEIKPSIIALSDVLFFIPTLKDSLPVALPPTIRLDAACSGLIKDLKLEHLLLETLSKTQIRANGTIRGLPDSKTTLLNLKLQKLYTTSRDITMLVSDTLLPKSLSLPEWIDITGTLKGTLDAPDIKSLVNTNLGSLDAVAKLNFDSTAKENYDALLHVNQFELGKLLNQDTTIGRLDLEASAKGRGFTMKNIDALVKLNINEFEYNKYTYRNFKVDGSLKKYFFSGTAVLDDKNLDLRIKGDLDYNDQTPQYKLTLELKNADFKALNLSQRSLRLRGILDVNMATADFKVLNGNINIRKVAVFNGEKLYAVDSLLFASIDQRGESEITINSDILSGNFKGNINLFGLPDALKRHVDKYFSLHDSTFQKPIEPQNFKFSLTIKNTDLLTEIILPDLEPFVPGDLTGEFDSEAQRLNISLSLGKVNYAGVALDSIWFKMLSNEESLDYTLALEKIRFDTLRMEELKFSGNVMNDSIYSIITILDSLQKEKYVLGGVFNSYENDFQFRFLPRLLTLNYDRWSTPMYNTLRFTDKGLVPNNFYISHNDERILLVKKENQDSTLTVAFRQVDLKNVTSFLEGPTPLGGIIDGELTVGVARNGSFNSELNIKELKILEQAWGDLALKLNKTTKSPIMIDLGIDGSNVTLTSKGSLESKTAGSEIHLATTLSKFNVAAIEPLTMKQLKDMKGQLTGDLKIDGNTQAPAINGELRFNEVAFTPTYVGSRFILKDERIRLTGTGLVLNDFKVTDANGNVARFAGSVKTQNYQTFDLNLSLDAKNFQVINTTEKDNELFYGNVRVNTKARITGQSDFPKIQVDASLTSDSEFTYVVPEIEKTILEQEGIVKFVDRDAVKDPFLAGIKPSDTVKSSFTGMDLTANIELNDKVVFNIVIDPVTGDRLSVKGNSTLTLNIDQTGDMQLAGRYEISEGSYNLSFYKLVKRQFSIEKGGTIVWSGDVLKPELDIRALYRIETSPIDLISTQITSTDQSVVNTYRQRLPFLVYLILKGDLLSPDISFQLDMPQANQNAFGGAIYARIKDINTRESDLNKQVFALLILKRFISDDPLSNQGGSDVASTARTSVSRLLSEQLNRLSENIKGVQLTFDVKSYEDYSTGTAEGQTQLQLGVSKSLLNDRLIVKVSGNVDVEGQNAGNQNSFSDYIGDLALEYKLTPDGRLRITGFRNSNYDMIDGELTETGAGLIYIKDYESLRELFKANAKEE